MKRELYALAQSQKLYILIDNKPVAQSSREEWMLWMHTTPGPVEQTVLRSGREIVTKFMGYCGEHRQSQPLTFATVFKPEPLLPDFIVVLEWHFTWQEAQERHRHYVQQYTMGTNVNQAMQKR